MQTEINYDWSKLVNFNVNMTDESQFEVSLSHKGTGIQRLFMVSYFQYLAEQSENDRSSYIFAIEEPETFFTSGSSKNIAGINKTYFGISSSHYYYAFSSFCQ